jgi:integrase
MPYYDKKKDRWIAQAMKQGKRKQAVFRTRKEAKAFEVKYQKMSIENWSKKSGTISLETWGFEYHKFCKGKFGQKTYEEKVKEFRLFSAVMGRETNVVDLRLKDILDYVQRVAKDRSGYVANNKVIKNLKAAWNWGIKYLGLPSPNPFQLLDKFPEARKQLYTPPEDDFWKVYHIAEGQDKTMLLTYLHTAGRKSEVFTIKWTDVHFDIGAISLWTRKRKDGTIEENKIPMTDELSEVLWEHKQKSRSEYVFVDEKSKLPYKSRQHWLEKLCKRAGVKVFSFHAIRRLAPSILASHNTSLVDIQAFLRHKHQTTTDRYIKQLVGIKPSLQVLSGGLSRKEFTSDLTSTPKAKGDRNP